ncbi:MAG: nucleotidyltransferase domain-containing protein [Proteobacteria bacterium]|nr:nucleotidyltransferase domain-containing protein [Pseudomonadota bacterium]
MVQEIYPDVERIVKLYIDALKRRVRIQRVILFGSYARGNPRPWSDIDLVVISPDFHGGTEDDHLLLAEVARHITPQIEALPYLPDDFLDCDSRSFEADILRSGKVIYDEAA